MGYAQLTRTIETRQTQNRTKPMHNHNKTNTTENNLTENADAIRRLTMLLLACNNHVAALPYAEQWTKLRPCESMPWTALSSALNGLDRHAEACAALDKAILVNSTDCLSLYMMAAVALYLKYRLREAEQLIRKALRLQADIQEHWYVLGRVLKEQGNKIEAMLCLSHAARMNQDPLMSKECLDMIIAMGCPDYSRN